MIAQIMAEEILADCSQNLQSAKIQSLPKFPAIRYFCLLSITKLYIICSSAFECVLVYG